MAASMIQLSCRRCIFLQYSLFTYPNKYFHTGLTKYVNHHEDDEIHPVSTDIARLKPSLHRRVKGEQPIWPPPPQEPLDRHDDFYGIEPEDDPNHVNNEQKLLTEKATIFREAYGKFGRKVIGIDVASLWPTPEEIKQENAKLEFFKPVAERIEDMRASKQAEEDELDAHQKKISENMAKMNQYLAQYEKRKAKRVEKDIAQVKRSEELLEEAREFFGYNVDKNDVKFRQMVEWKEEQEKTAKKRLKRDKRKNILAHQVAQLSAELGDHKD